MRGRYHFAEAQPSPEKQQAPICAACAAGYHEQFLLAHERCDCPCHGTQTQCINDKVAA
jgi:hypothetical protein